MKSSFTTLCFKTSTKKLQNGYYLAVLILLLLACPAHAQRSFLGADGGFEGIATIVNGTTNTSPVVTNWTKSTTTATIATDNATVRSGSKSLKVTSNSSTLCRVFSPSIPITASTTAWQIQYYRRSTNITNTVENQSSSYRTGIEQGSASYTSVAATNTWERVTYSPSLTTSATTAAAAMLVRQRGTGGDMYYDDFVLYESATVDITAPSSSGTVTVSNATATTLDVSWNAATGGVDGGGYMVVRYSTSPNVDNDPNVNGVYGVGNTIANGTGSLVGTVCYVGTGTSFTDTGLTAGGAYYYKVYTYDKAYNYATETQGIGTTVLPTITGFSPTTACAGSTIVITGTNFTGAASVTIGGALASSFTVNSNTQITAVVGAASSGSVSVNVLGSIATMSGLTINAGPTAPTVTAGGATSFCIGGSVVLTASSGTSYLWSNGATSQSITVSTSGSYTAKVFNSGGCVSAASIPAIVSAYPIPSSPVLGSNSPICEGNTLNLTASTIPVTGYTMNSNSGISFVDISATGTSIGTITNDSATAITIPSFTYNGVSYTSATVSNNGVIFLGTVSGLGTTTNVSLPSGTTLSGVPFLAPYWDDLNINSGIATIKTQTVGNVFIIQYTGQNHINYAAGTITFQVQFNLTTGAIHFVYSDVAFGNATYDNGASATVGIQMGGNSGIQYVLNSAGLVNGQSITFTPKTATYSWTGPNGFTAATQNPAIASATTAATGVYSVVLTDSLSGCQNSPVTTFVTVNGASTTALTITAGGPTSFCIGGNVVLTASVASGYLWSTGATTQSITVSTSGSYTVQATGSGCPSILSAATLVTVNALPTTPTITPGGTATLCSGSSTTLTASAANGYLWSNGATTQSIAVTSTGSYTVSVTNSNGCQSAVSSPTVVSGFASPPSPTASYNEPLCEGSALNLTASNVQLGGYTMNANSGVSFIDISTTGTSIGTISDDSETNISVPSFNFNGITYTTARIGTNGAIAFGSTAGDISASNVALPTTGNTAGTIFLAPYWDDLNTVTGPGTIKTQTIGNVFIIQYTALNQFDYISGTITFQVQLNLVTGAIHFVYQDVITGSATYDKGITATVGIQMSSTSAIQYSLNTASLSNGQSITFSPFTVSYLWTGPNGFTSTLQNPTIPAATAAANGVYSVVSVNNTTGCQSTPSTKTITLNPALNLTPTITAGGPTTFCGGGSVVLTASGGSNYLWSTGATTPSITVSTSGSYTVQALSAFGCPSFSSAPMTVTVNPAPATPTITAGGSTTICSGTSVTLTSSAATNYLWSTGETTQSISVSATDSYTVQVRDAIGCRSATSAETIVTMLATPAAPTATNTQSFCNSAKVSNLTATGTALKWYNVATGGTALLTTASIFTGTYYVSQTVNGCESPRKAVTVAVYITPPPVVSNQTFCNAATVANLVATGTSIKWYLFSTGFSLSPTAVLADGDVVYATQTLNGCESATTPVTVTISIPPVPTALQYQIHTGSGTLADLSVTGTGIKWYTTATGGTALPSTTALGDGVNYYASQTVNSCESISRVAVTVKRISDPVQNFCGSATVSNLVASPLAGQVANWFSSASSTVVLPGINALTTKTYYVEESYLRLVSTLAGGVTYGYNNGTGPSAQFSGLTGMAVDANGNVFVSEADSNSIRKITPAGVVTTFAGNPNFSSGSADGVGTAARFYNPYGLAFDKAGNLYVADTNNHRIRKISPAGVVSTLAGGVAGYADSSGSTAKFNQPTGIAIDSSGDLYVTDTGNNMIRKVTSYGSVTTFAGSTTSGIVNATGTNARFTNPSYIAIDKSDNLYIGEASSIIRKITPAGVVTSFAGGAAGTASIDGIGAAAKFNLIRGITSDETGSLFVVDYGFGGANLIRKVTSAAEVTTFAGGASGYADGLYNIAKFETPTCIAADTFGNVFVGENTRVRALKKETFSNRVPVNVTINDPNGAAPTTTPQTFCNTAFVSDLVATGVGTTSWYDVASGGTPLALTAALSTGTYYASKTLNGCESNRTPATITVNVTLPPTGLSNQIYINAGTIANLSASGTNVKWYGWPSGSPALSSATDLIDGLTYYASQTLNGCESNRGLVVRVKDIGEPDLAYCGSITANALYSTPTAEQSVRWYGTATSTTPLTTESLSTGTYYVEQGIFTNEVKAFVGSTQGAVNGTGAAAQFNYPIGITTDSVGNAYVADSANDVIRKITPDGVTTTFSGVIASNGFLNGSATVAKFNSPTGVVTDGVGNLYVTDQFNNRIRKITASGTVSTFAGSGVAGAADGTGIAAQFNGPVALTIDLNGNLYVADQLNHRIRKITPAGVVTTVAGSTLGYADGVVTAAQFNYPMGLAVDANGTIYVVDKENNRIRKIAPNGIVTTLAGSTVGFTDGNGTAAQFNSPSAIVTDGTGNLYVSDTNNHSIRKIAADGTVSTLAGNGSIGNTNGAPAAAQFNSTSGITMDKNGTLLVTDYNHLVRKIVLQTVSNRLGINVTVYPLPPAPTITASGPITFCSGNNVVLTSSPGNSYYWSSGVVGSRYNPVYSSGNYTVRIGDANGCLSPESNPITVTVNPLPQTPIVSSNAPVCQGDTLNLTATNVGLSRYLMNGNSGIPFIDISNSGTSIGPISDDSMTNITMPPFMFNGVVYTSARISTNGVIVFGNSTVVVSAANTSLFGDVPGASETFLSPYWDDLNVINTSEPASIKTQTVGDYFIIQYTMHNHYQFYGGTITFQVQMSLSSGIIHYVYQDVEFGNPAFDNGITATVGLKMNGNNQVQYSFNTSSLVNGQSITFLPVLPTYEWTVPNGSINFAQNPTLPGATSSDTGRYTLRVVDPYSSCRSVSTGIDALVKVTDPPVVATSQSFCPFVTVADLVASGQGPISWYNVATGGTPLTSVTPLSSGTYYVSQYLNGCESLRVAVQVTINPITTSTINVSACGSYTWPVNNQTYAQTGTYTVTGATEFGCLDTKTLVLTIGNNTNTTQNVTACGSYTWSAGTGATYTQSGTYTYVNGCQTQTLQLTISSGTTNTATVSSCDSYYWLVSGQTYTVSGTYTYVNGCETKILVLTILPRTSVTTDITVCNSYTWPVNGQTYSEAGTYTYENGCRTEILNLNLACASVVNLKLNIEGYYDTNLHTMRPVLANQGIGNSTLDVDNIIIELRDNNGILVNSTTTMLHVDGTATVSFNNTIGSYYLVVKHRNAIETWSANLLSVGITPTSYDFTTSASKAYGSNMKMLETGVYGLYSGDLNQDGFIEGLDYDQLLLDSDNLEEGYKTTDLNGDGFVEGLDYDFLLLNSDNLIESSHP